MKANGPILTFQRGDGWIFAGMASLYSATVWGVIAWLLVWLLGAGLWSIVGSVICGLFALAGVLLIAKGVATFALHRER